MEIRDNSISVGLSQEEHRALVESSGRSVQVHGVRLFPETLSSVAWADNETLFTCKVRAEATEIALGNC